jgi:glycosyltransferase involved in cell wall biosynthesis
MVLRLRKIIRVSDPARFSLRILMVQKFYFYRGGDSTYMLNLSRLLEDRGHEVIPFSMQHPDNLPSPYSNYFVSEIDFPSLLGKRSPAAAWNVLQRSINNREASGKIARLIDEVKPDIAHFHNIHDHLTTSIVRPLQKKGIPIVWTLHDYRLVCPNSSFISGGEICERCIPGRFYNVFLHRCKKGSFSASFIAMLSSYYEHWKDVRSKVERYIAPSDFVRSKLIEGGFAPNKIVTIPNFIDLDLYHRADEEDYYVYFGRLLQEKGIDILIRATERVEGGKLKIAGSGPAGPELKELASSLESGKIEFLGHLAGDQLRDLVSRAQFAVLPARWYENLPFSIMEAFAAGVPVVASDIGGIPEMVDDGVDGYLFSVGDVESCANSLRRMLRDRGQREKMGDRARDKAERFYNRELHYRRIMDIYREACGS